MFNNLNSNNGKQTEEKVSAGFQPWESGLYPVVIKMAYGIKSKNGALGVAFEFENEKGETFKENMYVTNKAGENTYIDKQTKEPTILIGFKRVNDICLITANKELNSITMEDRVLEVYDADAKGTVKKPMPVLMDLLNQKVILGVRKTTEFKTQQVGDKWVDTDETRTSNSVDFIFHPEKKITVAEAMSGVTEPTLYVEWDKNFTGKHIDKTAGKGGNKPKPKATGSTFGGNASADAKPSLFGNN